MARWSGHARADLKAIHDVIARDSTHYARKVIHELVEKTDELAELRQLGERASASGTPAGAQDAAAGT